MKMITVGEIITQLPSDSQKRIDEMTKVLISEESFHTARKEWLQERPAAPTRQK